MGTHAEDEMVAPYWTSHNGETRQMMAARRIGREHRQQRLALGV